MNGWLHDPYQAHQSEDGAGYDDSGEDRKSKNELLKVVHPNLPFHKRLPV